MIRPKLFLDTNICIDVAAGKIDPVEWNRVRKHIGSTYRYCISFVTRKELISKLARGSEGYFERNKEPLRVLFRPGKPRFLPYPSVFAIRTVLVNYTISRPGDTPLKEEKEAEAALKVILQGKSKMHLKTGVQMAGRRTRQWVFDLDGFDIHENRPQREHAELLQGIREGRINKPEPMAWATWILHQHGLTPYTDDCNKLAASLDAAFRFSASLGRVANDKGYDFTAHSSDWGDTLQLFYLCDPTMHFLTQDSDFRNRTQGSPQRDRILLYREFIRSLPSGNNP
jgi:hypothetical protein